MKNNRAPSDYGTRESQASTVLAWFGFDGAGRRSAFRDARVRAYRVRAMTAAPTFTRKDSLSEAKTP